MLPAPVGIAPNQPPSTFESAKLGCKVLAVALAGPRRSRRASTEKARLPSFTERGLVDAESDPESGKSEDEREEEAQQEKLAAGWALLRAAFRMGPSGTSSAPVEGARSKAADQNIDLDQWRQDRAFDIAESMEEGAARETSTDFTTPLRRSSRLWRFRVVRSEDRMQARLLTDGGDFLMHAQISLEARNIAFFLYDPGLKDSLYESSAPAFSMGFSEDHSQWRLVQERCENCQFSPPHLSCARSGKQQLAFIRHFRAEVGEGISNCMEVKIPGLYADGGCVVWCPMLGRKDLAMADPSTLEAQELSTMKPVWNNEVESLVLDFKGRQVESSAKNFQISLRQKPTHVICQYGKLGSTNFGLDFRYPLSVIQAFGISLTTIFWR